MNRFACLAGLGMAVLSAGCREDMQNQPKYTPLAPSTFYPDGRAARPVPEGTVAFDENAVNPSSTAGTANGAFATEIPIPVTSDLLKRGQDRFNIYCSPCHGVLGNGVGFIPTRGLRQPADLTGARVRNAPPGYVFEVITHGYGAMGSYAYQLKNPRDRWAIVAYIRALELAAGDTIADVPAGSRQELEAQ